MSAKLTCFVIAPIGETGSAIRQDSDDLLDLIIKPSLEVYGIDVIRGDHRNESGQIDVDVIKLVQESDLCIVDLSVDNVNVYYELGRRDETGKPIILLKSASSPKLPIDIATRRYIEFNLDDRRAIISSRDKIKESVQIFINNGMEKTKGTSLYAISEKIDRIERNIARLLVDKQISNVGDMSIDWEGIDDPNSMLRVALLQKNIPMAEAAMMKLQFSMEELTFYDYVVEQVAVIGSRKAGEMLIDYMENFMDAINEENKKVEYLASLITYLNITNQEATYLNKIEPIALTIRNEEGDVPAAIHNQLSRLHYGLYVISRDFEHLEKATEYSEKAIGAKPDDASYHYNLAKCYEAKFMAPNCVNEEELCQLACEYARKAVALDADNYDEDHIALACSLCHRINNMEWIDYLELLKKISPYKAILLKQELK